MDRVVNGRRRRYDPVFSVVQARQTDAGWALPLSLVTLLSWAWQRWEIEVCHREMKTGFGLGEIQSWAGTRANPENIPAPASLFGTAVAHSLRA